MTAILPRPRFIDSTLALPEAGPLRLPSTRHWPESHHVFDAESILAVNAALAAGRPLLLRGEPGTGKSQLARAAAVALNRPFLSKAVNARLEPEDLLFRFDAVARLAQAQVLSRDARAMDELAPGRFLLPEILWWALSPNSARTQYDRAKGQCGETVCPYDDGGDPRLTADSGSVVLIDEIDKADSEVPNSLLEVLSVGGFQPPYGAEWVRSGSGPPPLIVITTNEDRELPAAFLRRCLVHRMDLPDDETSLREILLPRVRAHPDTAGIPEVAVRRAIQLLAQDRQAIGQIEPSKPGQAELLDLLRAVNGLCANAGDPLAEVDRLKVYAYRKHRQT